MTDTSLEPIMTDLINEVFKGAVTLEDLVVHLKDTAHRDLENVPVVMIMDAIKGIEHPPEDWNDPKESHIDWDGITFGCSELLALCKVKKPNPIQPGSEDVLRTNMDMCMYFLCSGLLNDAHRWVVGTGELAELRETLTPFCCYQEFAELLSLNEPLTRLLRYIFRP